jgi:hypothetical protein
MVTALTTWPTADTNATEALWGEMVSSWFTDGVCGDDTTNHFQVTADGSGMQVFVDTGHAINGGFMAKNTSSQTLAIDASGASIRRDYVVLRLDTSGAAATIGLTIIKGAAGGATPTLVHTSTVKDTLLYVVTVGAGVTNIDAPDLADKRLFSFHRSKGAWLNIGAGSNPGFSNGWSNFGGVDRPAGFRQDADGMVYLRGFVHGGSSGSYMFTLPPGCHPLYNEVFSIIHDAPASSGLIIINQVGQIIPILQAGFSEVSLASIQFQADGS